MSIEIKSDILAKELNQGIVPLGVPKAYQYDAALVEAARAAVNQGIDDVAEAGATAKAAIETQETASVNAVSAQEQASKADVSALGDKILNQMKHGYGYPFTAATAAAMTDTAKIYVYTGSETGYTNGNWYYWNGTAWTSGGVYNATALETDTTLTVSGAAADAKVVGDDMNQRMNTVYNYFDSTTLQTGKLIDENGNLSANADWAITQLIPVQVGDIIEFAFGSPNVSGQAPTLAGYNSDYEFIEVYKPRESDFGDGKMVVTNSLVAFVRYNVAPTKYLPYANQYLRVTTNKGFTAIKQLFDKAEIKDYFDTSKIVEGYFLRDNDGVPVANALYNYLETYIPVHKGDIVMFPAEFGIGGLPALIVYDKNKQFISRFLSPAKDDGTHDLAYFYVVKNENAAYVRYNVMNENVFSYEDQYLKVNSLATTKTTTIDYFDERKLILNTVVNDSGKFLHLNGYAVTPFIPVKKGDVVGWAFGWYIAEREVPSIVLYDENGEFIAKVQNSTGAHGADKYVIDNHDVAYIRYNVCNDVNFSWKDQYINVVTDEPEIKAFRFDNTQDKTFYVGSARTGKNCFTKLIDLTTYIENGNVNGATVYFDAEEFDIAAEYGSDYLDSYTYGGGARPGPRFGFNTHYVFAEGSKITFDYDGENTEVYTYFSPVNICGSCVLDGANIVAENCRYCVHDDLPTSGASFVGQPYTVEYKNCNMNHVGNSSNPANAPICIGGGCNKNTRHIIDGGKYVSNASQTEFQISYHNYRTNDYGNGMSEVIIRNIYASEAVRYGDYGDSQVKLIVNGCYLPDGIKGSSTYFEVTEWNNTNIINKNRSINIAKEIP